VKDEVAVEAFFSQINEILDGVRCLVLMKFQDDVASAGLDCCSCHEKLLMDFKD
jgi:hypothetical protein